ncbi:hypothetical protein RUM44_008721 [Polyplax serrata]|uniref:Ankyrin repeat domain-containing protein n=1 Tax=Polyplax serrata TaxID=468196 RepID=A0ABR1B9C1_POLSC
MPSIESIREQYPLHWLAWNNDFMELEIALSKNVYDKEMVDCRGRTPLMLAVTLGHLESVKVLVQHLTNVNAENKEGWTVVQEAVATGDPEMVQLLLERRDVQRQSDRMGGIPQLLDKLREAPDFYVEMKWEFSSWVPLVSRMCPSDTYKVYKQGSSVRVDTTLLGFDQSSWQRGNRSYIFVGESDSAVMMEIDHETEEVFMEQMKILPPENFLSLQRSVKAVSSRLTSPIVTTYIDTDKINFERNKAGLWGWRSDKTEHVNGHNCKVFSATNVELVTKTRLEHLTDSDKEKAKSPKTPLQSFLGIAETEHRQSTSDADSNDETLHSTNPCKITPEEYFDPSTNLEGRDIGRPKEVVVKVQKFKANLWLCEDYPLSLQEQIMPIVDLMAISSSHFAKLKDFIQMQLPSGFPIKIEIPLFHILHARITFGNIFGLDEAVPGVQRINDNGKVNCIVSDSCFEPPPGYAMIGPENRRQYSLEEEDDLIQFAIQQSLLELGSEKDEVDIWEALRAQKPSRPTTPNLNSEEARQLQRAIQASLEVNLNEPTFRSSPDGSEEYAVVDEELSRALALSQRHHEEEERRQKEEEDIVRRVLELSLTEQ